MRWNTRTKLMLHHLWRQTHWTNSSSAGLLEGQYFDELLMVEECWKAYRVNLYTKYITWTSLLLAEPSHDNLACSLEALQGFDATKAGQHSNPIWFENSNVLKPGRIPLVKSKSAEKWMPPCLDPQRNSMAALSSLLNRTIESALIKPWDLFCKPLRSTWYV